MPRAAVLLLAVLATPSLAGETVESDDWYAVYVNGSKAGHAHTVVSRVTDDAPGGAVDVAWITTTETLLRLSRQGAEIVLDLSSRVEEDPAGRVTAFRQEQRTGAAPLVTTGRLDGDVIRLEQNGRPSDVPYPGAAVGPAATDRRVAASGFDEGAVTTVLGFSADSPGSAAEMTFTVGGREPVQVVDRRLVLHRVVTTNSLSAARRLTMWYDGTGKMHVSESEIPGVGVLRMTRTSESLARAASRPADVFASSLITPDRGIEGPRRATHAVFRLRRGDGTPFETDVYAGEGQAVGPLRDDGSRDVTVDVWTPPADLAVLRRPVDDPALAPYLAGSAYLEVEDPLIARLAAEVAGERTSALELAPRIEGFVRRHVSDKSMDVGIATAAEVARTREGDCTEHAMLAAALGRAMGLPTRVVMGLVYVPGMSSEGIGPRGAFGYHMWTEVLVARDRWLPIDAAIGTYDATHIALAKSDLSATSPVSKMILPMLEAIASIEIEVVSVRHAGEDD